jgi:hypothetical protein
MWLVSYGDKLGYMTNEKLDETQHEDKKFR